MVLEFGDPRACKMMAKIHTRTAKAVRRDLPGPTHEQFLRTLLATAKTFGWKTAHFRKSTNRRGQWRTAVAGDGKGWCDVVCVKGAVMLALELKVGRDKPSPEQLDWVDVLGRVPGVIAEVVRWEQWEWIEGILRGST